MVSFSPRTLISSVEAVLDFAIKEFCDHPDWKEERRGGYLCVADVKTGLPTLVTLVGEMPPERRERSFNFSQEKNRRLANHPGHMTSYESRNPDANEWGGAVRLGELALVSFSGLPELADEAVVLAAAVHQYWVDPSRAVSSLDIALTARIVQDRNEYWEPLRKLVAVAS